mmetsp:Transcript_11091/g.16972  ORF Transcript_11091/g.16972 Transcript_11091/m.16972 type:complete len:100 (-) Transcript_11091:970-1269(-)
MVESLSNNPIASEEWMAFESGGCSLVDPHILEFVLLKDRLSEAALQLLLLRVCFVLNQERRNFSMLLPRANCPLGDEVAGAVEVLSDDSAVSVAYYGWS